MSHRTVNLKSLNTDKILEFLYILNDGNDRLEIDDKDNIIMSSPDFLRVITFMHNTDGNKSVTIITKDARIDIKGVVLWK